MAVGDWTTFEEFSKQLVQGTHDFEATDTIKFGIVAGGTDPTASDSGPDWSDYSAGEISAGTSYTAGGPAVTTALSYAGGAATITGVSFTIAKDASHSDGEITDAWGILYNSSKSNVGISFIELGTINLTISDVVLKFNNAASGEAGNMFTVTVSS